MICREFRLRIIARKFADSLKGGTKAAKKDLFVALESSLLSYVSKAPLPIALLSLYLACYLRLLQADD